MERPTGVEPVCETSQVSVLPLDDGIGIYSELQKF
jgi:hypothetical protein